MERMKREREEEWVGRAIEDDEMVAELLLRLRKNKKKTEESTRLAWGNTQPRSISRSGSSSPAIFMGDNNNNNSMMMRRRRCSPTTPLSWGSHDSITSKGTCTNDSVAFNSDKKCSKRKKSFSELQEEARLLKGGEHSNTELEMLHVTLKKQKVKSENMTRLKTDLHQQSAIGVASKPYISEGLNFNQANGGNGSIVDYFQASNKFKAERGFVLPDLNMTPPEDDSAINSLNGFS